MDVTCVLTFVVSFFLVNGESYDKWTKEKDEKRSVTISNRFKFNYQNSLYSYIERKNQVKKIQ